MLVYFITEVSSCGTWPLLEEIQDPELKGLADKLPERALKSRADSTTKKYLGAILQMEAMGFEAWGKVISSGWQIPSSVSPIYWRDQWL